MAGYGEAAGGTFATNYWSGGQGPSSSSWAANSGAMGALSGGITGASAGFSVGGPVGAIIGGAIGIIGGGILGGRSGSEKAKAKRYQLLAAQVQQQREANKDYNSFLQMIRQQRIARAATLSTSVASGTEMTSKTAGAVSGQQAQTAYSIQYLAEDRRLQTLYDNYMRKAGRAASTAQDYGAGLDAMLAVGQAIGSAYAGRYQGPSTTTTTTTTTPQITPAYVTGTLEMNPVLVYQN